MRTIGIIIIVQGNTSQKWIFFMLIDDSRSLSSESLN
ncbi:hypothetical protein EPYR_01620 [Erwinia pyrifoliae DSM 12163]|nr:hypothetical protein EPYR_01620 [Erwinia pyrifoliae DSM 12163]